MAAVIEAAKQSTPVFPLAALPLFAEKSHQGHRTSNSTFRPGAVLAISNTATGFGGCLYDSGTWSCCTSKERDSETGLDNFISRYFSSAQGRFTSPDDPFAGSDRTNPQSWNLFSYGLNNPLRYSDPDGHDPCENGVNPENGNICTVVTAPPPPPVDTQTSTLGDLSYLFITTATATYDLAQQAQQVLQPVIDYISQPKDPLCTAGYTALGASVGFYAGGGVGALGLAGGPTAAATIPGGAFAGTALGGGAGRAVGQVLCTTSSGPSGGGGTGGGGSGLTAGARKKLGNLASRAGEKVRDVIRSRGGTASNVNQAGPWADKTLGEAAQAAANGDPGAETAIKIAKQAGRLGQQY